MRRIYQLVVFATVFLFSIASFAQVVSDLTVGTAPVSDRSQASLAKVAPQALKQVLIKMSGNPGIAALPEVQATISNAPQLIQTFSYSTVTADGQSQLMVNIRFDKGVLDNLLNQAHQAIWRSSRPMTLAWINLDQNDNNPNTILSSDEQLPTVTALKGDASRLGLPMILPAMDLQDQAFINDSSAMPFDTSKLAAAAKRYQVNSVLAGNISSAVDGSWQGQWIFILKGQPHQWNTVGASPQAVIMQAVQDVDSIMSSVLAVRDNSKLQTKVAMQVTGVSTLDDYALVMNDLKQLNAVAHIGVAQLDGATMQLQISVVGGKKALMSALQNNTDLSQVEQPVVASNNMNALFYQFVTNNTSVNSTS
jgi:hypothetical protein